MVTPWAALPERTLAAALVVPPMVFDCAPSKIEMPE